MISKTAASQWIHLNRLEWNHSIAATIALAFAAAANLFTILVSTIYAHPEPGSMALVPESETAPTLPLRFRISQAAGDREIHAAFDLAVRDGKTGSPFLAVEGSVRLRSNAQSLAFMAETCSLTRVANALGRPSDPVRSLARSDRRGGCNRSRSTSCYGELRSR